MSVEEKLIRLEELKSRSTEGGGAARLEAGEADALVVHDGRGEGEAPVLALRDHRAHLHAAQLDDHHLQPLAADRDLRAVAVWRVRQQRGRGRAAAD